MEMEPIYCAYDTLNPTINPDGTEKHWCSSYNTYICLKCPSRFDGERIKNYMENNPKEH
jgi:hypothetical protein